MIAISPDYQPAQKFGGRDWKIWMQILLASPENASKQQKDLPSWSLFSSERRQKINKIKKLNIILC